MIYRCSVCGHIFNEEKEGRSFSDLTKCPVCNQPIEKFIPDYINEEPVENKTDDKVSRTEEMISLEYPAETRRTESSYRYMKEIHDMAVSGKSIIEAMGTQMQMPSWDDILILGAQLNPMPLDEHAPVSTMTVIGKHAKRPMILGTPVYISHMSFGALSKEVKVALSAGSAMAQTAMCSGEGGILPEEKAAAYKYIFE